MLNVRACFKIRAACGFALRGLRSALSIFSLLMLTSAAQANTPVSFSFQGVLTAPDGSPSADHVKLRLQILAPNECVLYEEESAEIDLSTSGGRFSVSVGGPLVSSKRTASDAGLAMKDVYSNAPVALRSPASNCSSGYTPTAGDKRKLRVTVLNSSGVVDTLTPDQILEAVPFAVTAQTLQGKEPGNFVQTNATLTQTKMDELAAGTSSLYVRADGSNLVAPLSANNQRISQVSSPTGATDAVNKSYADSKLAGQAVDISTAPTDGQVLVWNNSLSKWMSTSPLDTSVLGHARANVPACTSTQASRWDGSAWSCITAGGAPAGGGATSHATTTGAVQLVTSTKINDFNFAEGGTVTLPNATSLSNGGSHFTLINSQSEVLPVFDYTGKFLYGMSSGSASDVYLFDNTTSAGEWRLSGPTTSSGLERKIVDTGYTGGGTGSVYADFISGSKYLVVYSKNTPDNKVVGRIVDINTTTKTVTAWGAEIDLVTSSSSISWVRVISSTKALVNANSSLYLLTLAPGSDSFTVDSSLATNCSSGVGRISGLNYFCWSSSSFYRYTISGSTITEKPLSSIPFDLVTFEILDSGHGILFGKFYSSSNYNFKAIAVDLTGEMALIGSALTFGSTTYYSYGSESMSTSSTAPVSTTSALVLFKSDSNATTMYKMTVDGSYNVSSTVGATLGYGSNQAQFVKIETNLYLTYPVNYGGSTERKQVINPASMTLALTPSKHSDCWGHRYAIGKCLYFTSISVGGVNKAAVRLEAGY